MLGAGCQSPWSRVVVDGLPLCDNSSLLENYSNEYFNPNSEGVPATHLSEGGGHIVPPPAKCSINGPNELKFCV